MTGQHEAFEVEREEDQMIASPMRTMRVINRTPHEIRIIPGDSSGPQISYPPEGEPVRLGTIDLGIWGRTPDGVPIEGVEFHHIANPPPEILDTWYIVSLPVALAYGRRDFLVPYLEVRDDAGRIVGCRMLARIVG